MVICHGDKVKNHSKRKQIQVPGRGWHLGGWAPQIPMRVFLLVGPTAEGNL